MEYYLISEDALNGYKPETYSKFLLRGIEFSFAEKEKVCIALLDFDDFKKYYDSLSDEVKDEKHIWCQEITNTNVSQDDFEVMEIILSGNIFVYILDTFGASVPRNVCAIIGGIAEKFDMTPIELFDYLNETQEHEA